MVLYHNLYVRRHIPVNKNVLNASLNKTVPSFLFAEMTIVGRAVQNTPRGRSPAAPTQTMLWHYLRYTLLFRLFLFNICVVSADIYLTSVKYFKKMTNRAQISLISESTESRYYFSQNAPAFPLVVMKPF